MYLPYLCYFHFEIPCIRSMPRLASKLSSETKHADLCWQTWAMGPEMGSKRRDFVQVSFFFSAKFQASNFTTRHHTYCAPPALQCHPRIRDCRAPFFFSFSLFRSVRVRILIAWCIIYASARETCFLPAVWLVLLRPLTQTEPRSAFAKTFVSSFTTGKIGLEFKGECRLALAELMTGAGRAGRQTLLVPLLLLAWTKYVSCTHKYRNIASDGITGIYFVHMHLLRAVVGKANWQRERGEKSAANEARERYLWWYNFGDTPVHLHAWFYLSIWGTDVQFMRTDLSLCILIWID